MLACAGLERLGLARARSPSASTRSVLLPAVGQGVLALEARADDALRARSSRALDDAGDARARRGRARVSRAARRRLQRAARRASPSRRRRARCALRALVASPDGARDRAQRAREASRADAAALGARAGRAACSRAAARAILARAARRGARVSERAAGRVILVGAGPGEPDLITLRGARALRRADVVVYDALAPASLLALAPPDAERIDVGKRGHTDAAAHAGGDHGAARASSRARASAWCVSRAATRTSSAAAARRRSACVAAGVPFEVVPGVSVGDRCARLCRHPASRTASLGLVRGRDGAQGPGARARARSRWDALAHASRHARDPDGHAQPRASCVSRLLAAGRAPDTPAAAVMDGHARRASAWSRRRSRELAGARRGGGARRARR